MNATTTAMTTAAYANARSLYRKHVTTEARDTMFAAEVGRRVAGRTGLLSNELALIEVDAILALISKPEFKQS